MMYLFNSLEVLNCGAVLPFAPSSKRLTVKAAESETLAMRTRFLSIDYFDRASEGCLGGVRISSLRFPVPDVDSPDHRFELSFGDFGFALGLCYELEVLPIEAALLAFFSEVFPRFREEFSVASFDDERAEASLNGEELIGFETSAEDLLASDDSDSGGLQQIESTENADYKPCRKFSTIEFEIPEMREKAPRHEEEEGIRFDISKIEIRKNIYEIEYEDIIPPLRHALESIYSVEDITNEYRPAKSGTDTEDCSIGLDRAPPLPWNLMSFEVPEIGLEFYNRPAVSEDYQFLLSDIEPEVKVNNLDLGLDFVKNFENTEVDILECLSHSSSQGKEPQSMRQQSLLETDMKGLEVENLTDEDQSMVDTVCFEGSLILEAEQFLLFEDFTGAPKPWDTMEEDFNDLGNFFDSLVDSELALLDDIFITFPVPILRDSKVIKLHSSSLDSVLCKLEPYSASACEDIYLDWHILQPDTCNNHIWTTYRDILKGVDTFEGAPEPHEAAGELMFDLLFCDDVVDELNMSRSNEKTDDFPGIYSEGNEHHDCVKPSQFLENGTQKRAKFDKFEHGDYVKPSQLFENVIQEHARGEPSLSLQPMNGFSKGKSTSHFNDLDFFVSGRKGATRKREYLNESIKGTVISPSGSSKDPILLSDSPKEKSQLWRVEVRRIKLSNHFLNLLDKIRNNYFSVLDIRFGKRKQNHPFEMDVEFLSLPKQKSLNLLTETSLHQDEKVEAYVASYAVKQIIDYLCFFGIYPCQLYISNLFQNLKYLKSRLGSLHSLIEEEYHKAEKGLIESHPSLSVIEEILSSHSPQNANKVLIIAERVFWWPLRRKLAAMNISFEEVRSRHTNNGLQAQLESNNILDSVLDAVSRSHCIIISHQHIISSFPFQKFSIVLEYGGSCDSSRTGSSPEGACSTPIIFLKVELEENSFAKAFSRRFDDSQHFDFGKESAEATAPALANLKDHELFKLLNFVPIVEDTGIEYFNIADRDEASHRPSDSNMPFPETSRDVAHASTNLDSIVIVNTQNFGKEMIISRRSSYQKILAMEKGGVQVVEREFNLPVDLILSPGFCLVFYDARSFGADGNVFSYIPEKIENIATNILMTLSFAFSSCIMVFEGEISFQAAVMEYSDELYAAAASLDMYLQLFYSSSHDLTDEIILSCIEDARKLNPGVRLPMPELESLAESFLTSFPSINPLSAHAILSGVNLGEFLGWSHERRVEAVGKYSIPQESIVLFSAVCRFGDLGESKSELTECASSVSSAFESDHSSGKMALARDENMHADDEWYLGAVRAGKIDRPTKIVPTHSGPEELENQKHFAADDWLHREQALDSRMAKDLKRNNVSITTSTDEEIRNILFENKCSLWDDDFSFDANARPIRRRLAFDASKHPSFPSSAEIDRDPHQWIPYRNPDELQDDTGPPTVSKSEALPGEFIFEEGEVPTPTRNSLNSLFHKMGKTPSGLKLLSSAIHSAQLKQGSPWTIEFLNRVKEKTKRSQQMVHPISCNTCTACPGSSRRTDKLVKRRSPSVFEAYRYQGGNKHAKAGPQNSQKRKPVESTGKEMTELSHVPYWTPLDKRAKKVLTFTRNGNEKQSKLVWDDAHDQNLGKRIRI